MYCTRLAAMLGLSIKNLYNAVLDLEKSLFPIVDSIKPLSSKS